MGENSFKISCLLPEAEFGFRQILVLVAAPAHGAGRRAPKLGCAPGEPTRSPLRGGGVEEHRARTHRAGEPCSPSSCTESECCEKSMRWDVTGKHWLSLLCSGREPSSAGDPERGFPGGRKGTRAPSRPRSLLEPGAASDSGGGS